MATDNRSGETLLERLQKPAQRVHLAGYPFITAGAVITLVLLVFAPVPGILAGIVTGWIIYFFRDPVRVVPLDDKLILSPADGRVQAIQKAAPPAELAAKDKNGENENNAQPLTRISIFLDIFDVHVNRMPTSGTIEKGVYNRGRFLNAAMDKASEQNERCSLQVRRPDDHRIIVVQIAGLIARRIVCNVKSGDRVRAGQRYGIIRFGSRVDVYLPPEFTPRVAVGQRTIGGETILGEQGVDDSLQTRRD